MQALSISDHSIVLKFGAIKKLSNNVNDLINSNIYMQKKGAVISEIQNLNPPTVVGDKPTCNNKFESIIVKETLNDEKHPIDFDNDDNDKNISDIPLENVAEKLNLKKLILVRTFKNYFKQIFALFQANIHSDYEPSLTVSKYLR